jgi:hypothetical protein
VCAFYCGGTLLHVEEVCTIMVRFCYVWQYAPNGLRTISGPRPLVTQLAKSFVNLLLDNVSSFIFITPKD